MAFVIESFYDGYFQKSGTLLFPALEITRGSFIPIRTYVSWSGHYTISDYKLICLYHLRNDDDFKKFEQNKLLGNRLFYDFKQVEDNKAVYIFDLKCFKYDWDCFISGKYSKMSIVFKTKIRNYIGINSGSYPWYDSFLSPEKYYTLYSKLLNIEESVLKEVGELGTIPDLEEENLIIIIKDLELRNKLI